MQSSVPMLEATPEEVHLNGQVTGTESSASSASSPMKRPRPRRRTLRAPGEKSERQLKQFAIDAARLLSDLHCTDIVVLDVRGRSQMNDYVVIATGTSDRQIRSVGESVQDLGHERGMVRFGREVDSKSSWVVVDFSEVVVHVFEQQARGYYDLEMLWGDAPRLRWRRIKRSVK